MWPAFWMLGANIGTVSWPACREIDVMEMFGGLEGDKTVRSILHLENDGDHAEYGKDYSLTTGIFADDFLHFFS